VAQIYAIEKEGSTIFFRLRGFADVIAEEKKLEPDSRLSNTSVVSIAITRKKHFLVKKPLAGHSYRNIRG
jgi:hypothetical protein